MTIYETSDLVKLNQTFENKEDFLMQLRTKCVTEGFQIKPKYSDKSRYTATCISPNCSWQITARCIQDSNNFQVQKLNDLHTCSNTQILPNNKHATKKVLGNILKETRSFVNYARPVIIVDGAHLKSRYLGTNLIAVTMDANNGILPLAYGIGAGETTDHWTWFFGNLRDSLQSSGCCIINLTIISDRAPAIAAGISNVFPEVFHALCARHLLGNLKSVSKRVKSYEWHYWKMCKAYRKSDFDHHYAILARRIPDSARTLNTVGLNRWSRHHADRVRYAYLTSNSAESMNALSVHARKLPITMLLEFFRASVQQWFWEH
ncbi:uncharacterized protein [Rutidosis leptorrhynchoides]|uniref:uncharacterized protein n=1 Tax=Rutidosis leptorrhynchoides TaxID=125765 RepID=UPI003A995B5B